MLVLLAIGAVPCAFMGWAIGAWNHKRRGGEGFLLGLILGPIGWLIVAVLGESKSARKRRDTQTAEVASAVAREMVRAQARAKGLLD